MLEPFSLFSLTVNYQDDYTYLLMHCYTPYFSTDNIPQTLPILQSNFPRILRSKCFNEKKLPFKKEVCQTELGHLFEHILLEYLSELKINNGEKDYIFNGETSWNWQKDFKGTFHIVIDAGEDDWHVFPQALRKSIELLTLILESGNKKFMTYANRAIQ